MTSFVRRLSIQPLTPNRIVTNDPKWEDVEAALDEMDEGNVRFFELASSNGDEFVMLVFGESGVYHVGTFVGESEECWMMLGTETTHRVNIAGNIFPKHQVCEDVQLVRRIVRHYFDTGEKSSEVDWWTELMEE